MIRDHILFSYLVTHEQEVMIPNPEAPDSGEMVRSGRVHQNSRTMYVIAASRAIADAWLFRRYSGLDKLAVVTCIEAKIDAFIETHTW